MNNEQAGKRKKYRIKETLTPPDGPVSMESKTILSDCALSVCRHHAMANNGNRENKIGKYCNSNINDYNEMNRKTMKLMAKETMNKYNGIGCHR